MALCVFLPLGLFAAELSPCADTNEFQALQDKLVQLNPPSAPKPGEAINRLALLGYLETEGRKLVDAGGTLCDWKDKLEAKTCELKLPSTGSRTLSNPKQAQREEAAVAVIGTFFLCDKCSHLHMSTASGFFITESGAFATCRHVLANYTGNGRGMVVMTRDGGVHAVREILASDPLNDLLVVRVAGERFKPLPLSTNAPIGSPVSIMSHPEEHFYTFTTGVVSGYSTQNCDAGRLCSMAVTADFARGSSGGPICNASGAVVGMVNNTQSIYYNVENGQQKNLQMVFKNSTPSAALMALIKKR